MGKLAEAAGARMLIGKVAVTDTNGVTTVYDDEAAAEKAIPSGAVVEHRRGAFFIKTAKKPAPTRSKKTKEGGDG